jgi:uncharacterized protein YaaQ
LEISSHQKLIKGVAFHSQKLAQILTDAGFEAGTLWLIRSADFKSQKLAQILTEQGFQAADLAGNGFCAN